MTFQSAGTPPAPPVAAAPTKNFFERLVGALFAPGETFEDIARKPDFLVPILFFVLIGYAAVFVIVPLIDYDAMFAQQEETIRKRNPNVSSADIAQMNRVGKAFARGAFYVSPVLQIGIFALIALILWGAFRLMGGDGRYPQAFSATLYAWVPQVIKSIAGAIVAKAQGSLNPETMAALVKSNPAFLVDFKEQPVLFTLLSTLDVFTIWSIILFVFGFAAISRFSRAKSAAIIITLWVIVTMVRIGFAAVTAGMNG